LVSLYYHRTNRKSERGKFFVALRPSWKADGRTIFYKVARKPFLTGEISGEIERKLGSPVAAVETPMIQVTAS
jgi:hypothetical protein